jgi:alkanesulfonate monooxygenase SsuD/methylene tetrahydromethanopterin reductase-like flavin-dependent oxidoreductase (luciferase family)
VEVGVLLIFQNFLGRREDAEIVEGEIRLGLLAEELSYDAVWPPEHHFTDYSASPDNIQFLSYLAGRTERIKLGTGAVIVPWNDPLRVVERIVMLDHLSNGRAVLGLGRGLARLEYEHFGIDMETSRDRFDEASRMIVEALDTGFIEGDGPYYPQIRTEIRPRPRASFRDRLYAVGLSPESVEQAARLGARLMTFSQQPWEIYKDGALAAYQKMYREVHGSEPLAPLTGDLMFCHEDAGRAEELAMEHMSNYFLTITRHYELMSEHFQTAKGYEFYATASELFRAVGVETAAQTYCQVQTWGTPQQILEKLRWRQELIGDFEVALIANYGGMPFEMAESSLRLFAREVLPELRSW